MAIGDRNMSDRLATFLLASFFALLRERQVPCTAARTSCRLVIRSHLPAASADRLESGFAVVAAARRRRRGASRRVRQSRRRRCADLVEQADDHTRYAALRAAAERGGLESSPTLPRIESFGGTGLRSIDGCSGDAWWCSIWRRRGGSLCRDGPASAAFRATPLAAAAALASGAAVGRGRPFNRLCSGLQSA